MYAASSLPLVLATRGEEECQGQNDWQRASWDLSAGLDEGASMASGSTVVASLGTLSPEAWKRVRSTSSLSRDSFMERLSGSTSSTGSRTAIPLQSKHPKCRPVGLLPIDELSTSGIGAYFHCMISYRGDTEDHGENIFALQLYQELLSVSTEEAEQIPRGLHGDWPDFAIPPGLTDQPHVRAIKVFLDSESLYPNEPWDLGISGKGGFVGGINNSVLFVPILSWHTDPEGSCSGSIGRLTKLHPPENDYLDKTLLELTVALELLKHSSSKVLAILPILTGGLGPDGRYEIFDVSRVKELSDVPSVATIERVKYLLDCIGVDPSNEMDERSVQATVLEVLQYQGFALYNEGVHHNALRACALSVVRAVKSKMVDGSRKFQYLTRKKQVFSFGTPQGGEVLDWLREVHFPHLAEVFAEQKLDSLRRISFINDQSDIQKLFERHQSEGFGDALEEDMGSGRVRAQQLMTVGEVTRLYREIQALRKDTRSNTLTKRMKYRREPKGVGIPCLFFRETGFDQVLTTWPMRVLMLFGVFLWGSITFLDFFLRSELYSIQGVGNIWHTLCLLILTITLFTGFLFSGYEGLSPFFWRNAMLNTNLVVCVIGIVGLVLDVTETGFHNDASILIYTRFPCASFCTYSYFLFLRFAQKWFWALCFSCHPGPLYAIIFIRASYEPNLDHEKAMVARVMGFGTLLSSLSVTFTTPIIYMLYKRTIAQALNKVSKDKMQYDVAWKMTLQSSSDSSQQELSGVVAIITTALEKEAAILTQEARWKVCSAAFWFDALMFDTCFRFHSHEGPFEHRGPISAKGKIRQRSRNLDDLFEDAREVHWYFQEWVWGWSRGTAEHIPGPVKNPPRAISKAIRVYDRDVALLTDLVRCTVVCDTLDDVLMFLRKLIEKAFVGETLTSLQVGGEEKRSDKKVRITSLKNRFSDDYDSSITQGYRDLSLGVEVCWLRHESGLEFLPRSEWGLYKNEKRHICEIQVHLRSIIEIKGVFGNEDMLGHRNYQEYRDLMAI